MSEYTKTCDFCELRDALPQVICIGRLTPHHIKKRTYGETRHDLSNTLIVCLAHHNFLETHKNYARKMGWVIDSKSALLEEPPTRLPR